MQLVGGIGTTASMLTKFGETWTKLFFLLSLLCLSLGLGNYNVPLVWIWPFGRFVSVLNGSFYAVCTSNSGIEIINVEWLVNGRPLENLDLDATTDFSREEGFGRLGFIGNLQSKHNNSHIKCRVTTSNFEILTSPDSSELIIQGYLAAVGSLALTDCDLFISLVWKPPFTLDIAEVDDDISGYCVQITAEFENEIPLVSTCGINMTRFNASLPYESVCYTYTFTVYAENIVGNGRESNIFYTENETNPEVVSIYRVSLAPDAEDYTYLMIMSAEICQPAVLNFTDINAGGSVILDNTFFNVTNEMITFTTENLMPRRRYNITVDINNGSTVSFAHLSTHGILSIDATPTLSEILMKITYYRHSNTRGAFLSVVFITDDGGVDFTKSALLPMEKDNNTLPHRLHSPGTYEIHAYDIEQDGTLATGVGYPAVSTDVIPVQGDNEHDQHNCSENCDIRGLSLSIAVKCRFLDDLDSTANGIQVIVQLYNASEVHKLYVNQSMDLHTPVTVPVERDGEYQVSIFAIREGMGILGSTMQYTKIVKVGNEPSDLHLELLGLLAIIIVVIILIVVVICCVIWVQKRKTAAIMEGEDL